MKRDKKFILGKFVFLNVFWAWIAFPVYADGAAYMYDKLNMALRIVRENSQIGFINYENGYEHLVLNVILQSERKGGETPEGMVWIFPVPSKPEDIEIDIMQDFYFPKKGKTVEKILRERLFTLSLITLMSQVYPSFLLLFPIQHIFRNRGIDSEMGLALGSDEQKLGIEVHKRVEKLGLTTELITASDGNAMETYLKDKGLNFPDDAKSIIQSYIGQNFSFVISWASDLERFYLEQTGSKDKNKIHRGEDYLYIEHPLQVFIKFKTDKIFFPMKLTRVYKDLTIPIKIYIRGFVIPDIGNMKIVPDTDYFINPGRYKVPSEYTSFYGGVKTIKNMTVTRVSISNRAEYFTEDLYFNKGAPPRVMLIQRMTFWAFPIYAVIFILVSCICSLFAGFITIPKKVRPTYRKLLELGLFNCLTLIGFVIRGNYLIEQKMEELEKQDGEESRDVNKYLMNEYIIKRRFYITFSILFIIFMLIVPYHLYGIYIYPLLEKSLLKPF